MSSVGSGSLTVEVVSSKGSLFGKVSLVLMRENACIEHFFVIGGERAKGRPCWMDDVMRWLGIGGEREKVGHVGLGRGVTSLCSIRVMSAVKIQNRGEESVTSRVLEKNEIFNFY